MFTKYTTSIIGDGDAIRWDPNETAKVDWKSSWRSSSASAPIVSEESVFLIMSLAIRSAMM